MFQCSILHLTTILQCFIVYNVQFYNVHHFSTILQCSSNLLCHVHITNLDLQNLFPQDSNPNIVTGNSQTYSQNTIDLNDSFNFNNF
ncbi:hypothetical protein RhiirC2_796126 [Rhizophagus irregularis]|uniref:Uncharacterized protein n=1 Tax=Rhizophagus irregularis TaxID=588596 RepID=A0A2N1MA84_9GLOM|nr:hypothetical protein RhiirC2_796126 [Rhizophagus irregularis]